VTADERLASHYPGRFLRGYVRAKLRLDPMYREVAAILASVATPLVDVGCGIGLLPFYLREHGFEAPVTGIDFDPRKVEIARSVAVGYRDVEFIAGDARSVEGLRGSFTLLDVIQYVDDRSQAEILARAASGTSEEGVVILRVAVRDDSWRYRLTRAQETLTGKAGWMRRERVNFPTRERLVSFFEERGFSAEVRPLWGKTPFNSYLFVFRRRGEPSG
jgi:SAM-dependent methyltransferase